MVMIFVGAGNESARGREAEWSSVALVPGCYPDAIKRNEEMRLSVFSRDLGEKRLLIVRRNCSGILRRCRSLSVLVGFITRGKIRK